MGEPLCTFELYEEFKSMGDEPDENKVVSKLTSTCEKMPPLVLNTFKALLRFIHHVNMFESDNKMSIENMAKVFSPNLF